MPAPKNQFKRPGIDLGSPNTREWRTVAAQQLEVGDILPDFGSIASITLSGVRDVIGHPGVKMLPNVVLRNINGEMMVFEPAYPLFAFTNAQ